MRFPRRFIMLRLPVLILKEIPADAPGEFQLLPDGKIDIRGEAPAFLDQEAATSILKDMEARGNEIVIDYEHQTLLNVEAPAAGWIKKILYKGKEGLWVAVEWTEKAKQYIKNKEYKYFSPVMWVTAKDRKVIGIENVALTNYPKINNLKPIIAKLMITTKDCSHMNPDDTFVGGFDGCVEHMMQCEGHDEDSARKICATIGRQAGKIPAKNGKEAKIMLEKLKKLLGLAADAAEEKVSEAVELLANKVIAFESKTVVACKEVLEAIGAKEDAKKEEVLQVIAGLKIPADITKTLSLEVATLRKELSEMKQNDIVQLALKEGKTSPDELDKWGRDLALKNPEQFKLIVLSRPVGSVIPTDSIVIGKKDRDPGMDEIQKSINKMMGISEATWTKYNPKN